ncbi:MAG: hypothetical protein JL50_18965 [Peptococcaceae bacterium BICA1-7]|nr:MAG: hypothetical protein JL50_18965 [Peptococcaceae bacterium BICA1-7]
MIISLLCTLPSCWDRREVERLGIVMTVGIESAPGGKVRVIVQNINPGAIGKGGGGGGLMGGGGAGGKPYRNRLGEGNTIFDAIRELSRETPRQLFFAHNQVIIISEEMARERGLREITDFFERHPQIRRTTWLLVGKGPLSALMDEPGRLEDNPAQRVVGIINERDLTSQYAVQKLGDFLEMMESEGSQPYTAVLERKINKAAPEEHKNRLAEGHIAEPHQNVQIDGTAIFRRDKMVGWLNSRESRGLLWIRGKVRGGVIDVPNPDQKGQIIVLEIIKSKTKLKPEIKDGQIILTADIAVESNLGETTGELDIVKPETVTRLEELQARAIQGEIESALARAQEEYGVDVFGFGEALHRKYPRQWKEMKSRWSELFPEVQVQVGVKAKIRRTGLITKPTEPKQR